MDEPSPTPSQLPSQPKHTHHPLDLASAPLDESRNASNITLSQTTRRLLDGPSPQQLLTNKSLSVTDDQLHSIVGQHLALTPTLPERLRRSSSTTVVPRSLPDVTAAGPSLRESALCEKRGQPSGSGSGGAEPPLKNTTSDSSLRSAVSTVDGTDASSRFALLGADVADDVYKWHERHSRHQIERRQSYHGPPPPPLPPPIDSCKQEPMATTTLSDIKVPGGFRRHHIRQSAASRGAPEPSMPTRSFIHFLGLFNMYEFDHFAGENFHAIPTRSIVVPKDLEKRRQVSLAEAEADRVSTRWFVPGQEVQEDEVVIDAPEEKISFSKAVGMLFKAFIASGILFMPNAFKNGGILFSSLVMVLFAGLCLHSFLLLVKCRDLHSGSYGDIGQYLYGRWMRYIVLFAIAISQFGFCCVYCTFFAQQFAIVVDSLGGAHLDKAVWIAIFFVILVPFTFIRNISRLGISTFIADLCIIIGLVYLYVYDIKALAINNGSPTPLQLFNSKDFGLFIGTAVFAYEGIGMVIPICSTMADPKQFPRALTIVLAVVCVLLVSFGAMGYAAYGDAVQTIILDNLPTETSGEKAGKNTIQLLYIIAIFLTTPLMLFPCIRIIEHMIFKTVGPGPPTKARLWKENAVRVAIDFAVAVVAYAGYYKLDIVISFVGSFACVPLLFIFPPLFHIKAFPEQPLWRKISDVLLILFGFLVFIYTLIITIQNFSRE